MSQKRFGVGIVGLSPDRSWAARAHIPALRALEDQFEICAVANSNYESAKVAAKATGIPRAFANAIELAASPDVDIVAVTVRVPRHLELVKLALDAGKHVFCEWPLGNGLGEAEELADLAKAKGLLGVIGTQARVAPEIVYLRALLSGGFIGTILASSLVASGGGWGADIGDTSTGAYLLDKENGATLLTIPLGHALAGIRDVLGDIAAVSAVVETRRREVLAQDTGKMMLMTSPDQVLLSAKLESGAPLSIHYRGGAAHGNGLTWEIYGTEGDIRMTAASGHMQMAKLTLSSARGKDGDFHALQVPPVYAAGMSTNPVPGNVSRICQRMASDLLHGTDSAPTFADAVELHRLLVAIDSSAASGGRNSPNAPNRPLPDVGH